MKSLNQNKILRIKIIALCLLLFSWFQSVSFVADVEAGSFSDFGVIRPEESRQAPIFSLKDMKGNVVSLEDFRGKVILLSFWATWCAPCKEEMPGMQKLFQHFQGDDFAMLAISIDKCDKMDLESFVEEMKVDFPILIDKDQTIRNKYFINSLPTSYLIGRDGKFQGFVSGQRDWDSEEARELVLELLQEKVVGKP